MNATGCARCGEGVQGNVKVRDRGEAKPHHACSLVAVLMNERPMTRNAVIQDAQSGALLAYAADDRDEWICTPIGRRRVEADVYGRGARRAA